MIRADYETDVCRRLSEAEHVTFIEVSSEDWRPVVAGCHPNVDYWVRMNPGTVAVRGWVLFASFGQSVGLTAHSVVQGPDGKRFDITPLADERPRKAMRFVEHLGDDRQFFEIVEQVRGPMGPTIICLEFCGEPLYSQLAD